MSQEVDTHPVAIVGGGTVGLVSSILLSLQKIPHVLYERCPSTSTHPKACGFNQRTVEIFRQIGIEDEIVQRCAPPETVRRTAWYTSLGPNGREIIGRDAWGGGQYRQEYAEASPTPYVVLPQIRLEPILQRRAQQLNPNGVFYDSEVTSVDERDDHVILTIASKGVTSQIKASYCIAADGGRGLTDTLNIGWEGERDIVAMISAHVRAPISLHHPDTRNFITWFINSALGEGIGNGYLYHVGPYPSTLDKEEWVFACALNPADPDTFDEHAMLARMHRTLQIPGLPVELLSLSRWAVNALCATSYRSRADEGDGDGNADAGRVFLVGNAAHQIPPWGALGLNTGIHDAHNLVWKLGLALRKPAAAILHAPSSSSATSTSQSIPYGALLSTYTTERRPLARLVLDTSLANLRPDVAVTDTALGIAPDHSTALAASFNAGDRGLGAEIGWFYPNLDAAGEGRQSRHDGQIDAQGKLDSATYHPSTIPGHHVPHAWVEGWTGGAWKRVSTRDLVGKMGAAGEFVVLTGPAGRRWEEIVRHAGLGEIMRVERILQAVEHSAGAPPDGSVWRDLSGAWAEVCGVGDSGAMLVRPDGIVAWRAQSDAGIRELTTAEVAEWFRSLMRWILKLSDEEPQDFESRAGLSSDRDDGSIPAT